MRRGLTLELGLGAALTHVAREKAEAESGLGPAALSIGVGGFVTPKLAILAREAGTTYFGSRAGGDVTQHLLLSYGVQLQYWANDWVSISAGPALAVAGDNPLLATSHDLALGLGASARTGIALLAVTHHVLRASCEIFNAKVPDAFVFGSTLGVEWQTF